MLPDLSTGPEEFASLLFSWCGKKVEAGVSEARMKSLITSD
jgi:hypothetical protein